MSLLGDNAKRSKLFLLGFVPKLISESHFDAHTICFLFYNKPQWKHIWKIKKWRKFFPKIMLYIHDLALCGFWDLKKPALHKICVSGTVGGSLLKRKSPTCAYVHKPKFVSVGSAEVKPVYVGDPQYTKITCSRKVLLMLWATLLP